MTISSSSTSFFRFSLASFYGGYLRRSFNSAGLSYQSIHIDDQTTISFWGPTQSLNSTGKPPLILIHGFGPKALWQWRQQVKALSSHFFLYVPDLVFFGDSTTKSQDRSEVFQAVSIGKLLEKLGVEKYSIVGTSYGGFVSYNMAKMWPERVEKVIIASSAVNKMLKDNMALLERAKVDKIEDLLLPKTAAQLRNLICFAMFKQPFRLPDFFLNDFLFNMYSNNIEEKKQLLVGLTLGRDDTVQLSPLQQEVLIIWGEHDQIFPLQKALELKEILGENVKLEVMKNTSHVPQIEDPNKFNDIVMKFLSRPS